MKKALLISLISLMMICGCTPIAHIGESGEIVIDRPDLYSATAHDHEKGHQLGLGHCPDKRCYMFFMDLGGAKLCSKCKAKLRPTTLDWLENFKVK